MKNRIIAKDFKNSKLVSVTIVVFLVLASLLFSTGLSVLANLVSSVNKMFEDAKTPHFMQMHLGDVDEMRLERFVKDHEEIEAYQRSPFLNIDGTKLSLNGISLSSSIQDNGLTTQNEHFDFLLDLDGQRIQAKPGELYVPLYYMLEMDLQVGDLAHIAGREFVIAGFVRDSQMNAALVSSKRFVLEEEDLQYLKEEGSLESLIEFRLFDPSKAGEIENAYVEAGLESNGPPAITHSIFRIINLITEGIFLSLLIIISLFILGISLLCVRFTVMAKIEEEYREIGILKAIGLSSKEVGKIYLSLYVVLAATASLFGYLLSFLLKKPLIRGIELSMGRGEIGLFDPLFGALGSLLIFLLVYLFIGRTLKKFEKISPGEALRFGTSHGKSDFKIVKGINLTACSVNTFFAIKDLLAKRRTYFTMVLVLVLSIFLMMVPLKMFKTMEDRSFMRYMGIGDYDLRIDLSQREDVEAKSKEIFQTVSQDDRVSQSNVLISRMLDAELASGKIEKLKVEIGDHEKFRVNYLQGHPPSREDEIALSSMIAKDLEIKVGDTLTLLVDDKKIDMNLCGIYSDITNGGKTAKASLPLEGGKVLWAVVTLNLKEERDRSALLEEYQNKYAFAKVSDVQEYIHQVFGSTMESVGHVAKISMVTTGILVFILTLLFMRMMYFKNRGEIAFLKAIGFEDQDIRKQTMLISGLVLFLSLVLGIVFTNTLGEKLSSEILSFFGAEGIKFTKTLLMSYVFVPLGLFIIVQVATMLSLKGLKDLKISRQMKESL